MFNVWNSCQQCFSTTMVCGLWFVNQALHIHCYREYRKQKYSHCAQCGGTTTSKLQDVTMVYTMNCNYCGPERVMKGGGGVGGEHDNDLAGHIEILYLNQQVPTIEDSNYITWGEKRKEVLWDIEIPYHKFRLCSITNSPHYKCFMPSENFKNTPLPWQWISGNVICLKLLRLDQASFLMP